MSPTSPLSVAVVGSGPSGVYAADLLAQADPPARVDVFEKLPAPFGLVRYGVAPDHPNIKQVIRTLSEVFARDGVRLVANVDVGTDVSLGELRNAYDAVVVATGCPLDAPLDIPGIGLRGSFGSAEFVSWYDGHPDAPHAWPLSAREVAIVGAGNVALDLARMLSRRPEDLARTDVPDPVLESFRASPVTDVHVFARRGPAQVRFSPMELKEMGALADVDVVVDPGDLEFDEASIEAIGSNRRLRQVVETLTAWAEGEPTGAGRRVHLHLLWRPVEVFDDGEGRVGGIRVERMRLTGDGSVEGTGELQEHAVQAVFRAIGYRGVPIEGLPFDPDRGVVRNVGGRVVGEGGRPLPGLYVVGWVKRGPSGLIGHSRKDAQETVDRILEDRPGGSEGPSSGDGDSNGVLGLLDDRGVSVVGWRDWETLDAHERSLGAARKGDRIKVASREEMLAIALGRA